MHRARLASTTICYTPELLHDELLYSWLCRLAILNAWGTGRDAVRKIFGGRTVTPSLTLPTHFDAMNERYAGALPHDSFAALMEASTLLPYHRPFLDHERYAQLMEDSRSSNSLDLKLRLGLVANRFGINTPHRFCPACVAEDIEMNGCHYWHRQHHLPGVNCCVRHSLQLQQQSVPKEGLFGQPLMYPGLPSGEECITPECGFQFRFAQLSADLLLAALPPINNADRSNVYRNRLSAKGFQSSRRSLDYQLVATEVRHYFADFANFQHQSRLLQTARSPLRWIEDLVERPDRSLHPICHLLMIDFLFGSIAEFSLAVDAERSSREATRGSAHAIPRGETKKSLQVPGLEIEHLLRNPSLSCRQIAQQTGKSVGTIVKYRRQRKIEVKERRKFVGAQTRTSIGHDLLSGLELQSIALRNGVSVQTIYRELAYEKGTKLHRQRSLFMAQRTSRRDRWMGVLKTPGVEGISKARPLGFSDYAWLYRHDRSWLLTSNAQYRKSVSTRGTVNWPARDQELCSKVLTRMILLLRAEPPMRISVARLCSGLGQSSQWRRDKLPHFKALLSRFSETPESFRIRRVNFAIDFLVQRESDIKLWKIQRAAGLRIWPADLIAYAQRRINEHT